MMSFLKPLLHICVVGLFFVAPTLMATDVTTLSQENLRPGVTEISRSIYGLHMFVIWVCVGIAVVVYGVLLYSIFAFRKSKGAKAASFSHSTKLEIVWTIIPIVLLALMAVPSVQVLAKMYDSSEAEIDILVTGYQWKWSYEYLDEGIKFNSNIASDSSDYSFEDQKRNKAPKDDNYMLNVDNMVYIPVNTKVRFLITANDVIHSWWVPDFAIKRDAIPGYINESWTIVEEPGIYRGQCAELCGKDHGYMPIVVAAVSKDEYSQWVASMKSEQQKEAESATQVWDLQALKEKGESIYAANCTACHQATGQGLPPAFPALVDSEIVNGDKAQVIQTVVKGVPGTGMTAFGNQLSDVELAAVITYIRSSWGNAPAEQAVQPQEIASQR